MADITKKPSKAVKSLGAPTRGSGNRKMTAKWSVPSDLTNSKKKDRATELEVTWSLGIDGKDPKTTKELKKETTTSHTINLDSLKIGKKTYTRSSFYPNATTKLSYVTVKVVPHNKKGDGPEAKATRKFETPKAPTVTLSFNKDNGRVNAKIVTDAGTGYAERYDTRYTVSATKSGESKPRYSNTANSTSTDFDTGYDVQDYRSLSTEDYVKVTVSAFARGYAGNSKATTRNFYVSYPAQATISDVSVPSKNPTDNCIVYINTNHTTEHPVESVCLEYLANVEYDEETSVPGEGWTTTDIVDNHLCTALACPVADLIPARGNHTWVRVKSTHECGLVRYSNYKMIEELETPIPSPAEIGIDIISVTPAANGESAIVVLGWNKDGKDDYTGTELSWSEELDTWKSTKEPNTFEFTWSDRKPVTKTDPETGEEIEYKDSVTITIKDLKEGEMYYVKARRYLESDRIFYSDYSDHATIIPNASPNAVMASCESYITYEGSLNVRWSLSGSGAQKAWQIKTTQGAIIEEGEGSISSTQISAQRLNSFAVDGTVTLFVNVSTGSTYIPSENLRVTIQEQPTLSVDMANIVTAQPVSFTANVSSPSDLIVIVTSQGANGQFPQGILMQASGDTVYSNLYDNLEWTTIANGFTTNIELPTGLDFWDLGSYTLSVTAVDNASGLHSEPVEIPFGIEWANPAVDPDGYVTLEVIDTVEEDIHTQAVQINLTAPEGSSETDVYDIYRMDVDKPHLIGEGFPLTYTAIDRYAPFGEDDNLFYRIALRTVDGDTNFTDIEYEFPCKNMRFDWADGTLELPYGNAIADSFTKDSDIRHHMDGSVNAYWNPSVERKSTLSSCIIKIVQPNDVMLARKLGRYTGAVFVRLPNGSAFEADVQVNDLSVKNQAITAMAVDATEIDITPEFMLPTPFIFEEEESE